jgi:hypothetical protein
MRGLYTGLLSVLLVLGLAQASNATVEQGALNAVVAPWGFSLVPVPGQTVDYYPFPPDPVSGERHKVGDGHVTLMKLYDDSAKVKWPPPIEPYRFDSFFDIFTEISPPNGPPVTLFGLGRVVFTEVAEATNTFTTEMLSMDLRESPTSPLMIRESPTKQSLGRTTVRESPTKSGTYQIDSFFDIFTELSLDGGLTWTPASVLDNNGAIVPVPLEVSGPVPEPCTLIIWSLLGTLGIGVRSWRRRKAA